MADVAYKELLAALVPSVTNFIHTYEEGLDADFLRNQVTRCLQGIDVYDNLDIIMTDHPMVEGFWAMVPLCTKVQNLDYAALCSHMCSQSCEWNHKERPTIYLSTTFDELCNAKHISDEEHLHILLKGFMVAFHELGHLLHLFVGFILISSLLFIFLLFHRITTQI